MAAADTARIRLRIRRELPPGAFEPRRMLAWLALALAAVIVGLSVVLATTPMPAVAALLVSVACGSLYGSLFFLGHEAGHGAVVKSRRGQDLLMFLAFAIFVLSPSLWRVWHNKVHHTRTNQKDYDPDNFGTLESYDELWSVRFVAGLTPGSGRWLSAIYLPTWFTVHAQIVLWVQSRRCRGFGSLKRARACAETVGLVAFWALLALRLGPWTSLLVIVIPMMTANTVIMSYIVTNHLLRPLVEDPDPLESSMSVTTWPWLDRIHFNFSHHVEHHLFPAMSSRFTPLVRAKLRRYAGARFLAPSHRAALRLVFRTPRVHDERGALVDPTTGQRTSFDEITGVLAAPQPRTFERGVTP